MQPDKIIEEFLKFIRQNAVVFLMFLFLVVDMFFVPFIFSQNNNINQSKVNIVEDSLRSSDNRNVSKISEIIGPRIDSAAASIEREVATCKSLPARIWIFLLVAYISLLIFNLAFEFRRAKQTQWCWELLLTLLALAAWYVWSRCGINAWYPMFILKMGILIYATYLYLFDMKKKNNAL